MVAQTYFKRVAEQTDTRLWINNPSDHEIDLAIEAGAINMTSNPSYAARLLGKEPEYMENVIGRAVAAAEDDEAAARAAIQEISERAVDKFLPLWKRTGGACGYVTVQDDPRADEDTNAIISAGLKYRALRPNFMAKIPVTSAGITAIEALVAEDVPICATECFSISQAVHVCELYERASDKTGKRPPFFVTHITGIFDEFLQKHVQQEGVEISPDVLLEAGCAVARKEYRILKQRGFRATMLGGGAREPRYFTEMVGGNVHITINWDMAEKLIQQSPPVVPRMDAETPQAVISELCSKLADFRRAYGEDGLAVEEFADFGGVRYFRDMFLAGYASLFEAIAARR